MSDTSKAWSMLDELRYLESMEDRVAYQNKIRDRPLAHEQVIRGYIRALTRREKWGALGRDVLNYKAQEMLLRVSR